MSKQNKRPKSKRRESFDALMARKGMSIVLILAVLILVVSIVSLSFSWFEPEKIDGRGAEYNAVISMRSEDCSIKTYIGTIMPYYTESATTANNEPTTIRIDPKGKISYSEGFYGDQGTMGATYTIQPGQWQYFRTDIHNNSNIATNVSLYLSQFPTQYNDANVTNSTTFAGVGLGVATPTNNYKLYTAPQPVSGAPGVSIIRNIYVGVQDDENTGTTSIEWFVKNESSASVTFDLSKLFLMYN